MSFLTAVPKTCLNLAEGFSKNRFLLYKGYKIKCSIGKKGTTFSKKEGDLSTPKGLFKIDNSFIITQLPYQ